MKLAKYLPWLAGIAALAAVAGAAIPPRPVEGFDLDAFARLPVLEGGRVKPLDSVARNTLLMIRGQQGFRHEGRRIEASEWLAEMLFRPQLADQMKVFVINDPEVLGLIGEQQKADRYYPFAALLPHLEAIEKQGQQAQMVDPKLRTRFQGAIANLYDRLFLYYKVKNTAQLETVPLAAELGATDPGRSQRLQALRQLAAFRLLPPPAGASEDAWRNPGEALMAGTGGRPDPGLVAVARMSLAWSGRDPAAFNAAVGALRGQGFVSSPGAITLADDELVFNRIQPFYVGMFVYVLAALLIFASWLAEVVPATWRLKTLPLRETAYALLIAGTVVHTAGLIYRIVLQGRPPVTNLYSSAVFVGWGVVVLGLVLEWMYRKGFATLVASLTGFGSLIVAHHLTGDGDTMEMMRAVLDSNFWLGTHVLTITIGYSGTYLAGAIAIGWAIWNHFAPNPEPSTGKTLVSMAYGIICFALFFSFIGTVLGGIWADQSWGRFWGWDPKENGALLIVLWNAIILHARWGGYARDRGIMSMAIFGNVITSLSWFGVNMLGVGLHSYGFMDKAFWSLTAFCASQVALTGLALAPRQFWKGRAGARAPQAEAAGKA
jgi:ABC-type transport system involved in cytochrome c biogenesis permease subunit